VKHEQVLVLQARVKEMVAHLDSLEKERDVHLAKVRFLYFLARGLGVASFFTHLMLVSQLLDIEILAIDDVVKGGGGRFIFTGSQWQRH